MSREIPRRLGLLVSSPVSVGILAVALPAIAVSGAFIDDERLSVANRHEAAVSDGAHPGDAANGLKLFGTELVLAFGVVEVIRANEKDTHKGACGLDQIAEKVVMTAYDPDSSGSAISRSSIVGCGLTQRPL